MRRPLSLLPVVYLLLAGGMSASQPPQRADAPTKTLAEWVAVLKDQKDQQGRDATRKALGPDGPFRKDAIPALIDALRDREDAARSDILRILADHGPAATPALTDALKRSEAGVRLGAAVTLGNIRPRPVAAVPAVAALMKDTDPEVRIAAAYFLGRMRGAADIAVPALTTGLADRELGVRERSAEGLGNLVRKPGPAVTALARTVVDDEFGVQWQAAVALRQIGPAAKDAVPILTAGLQRGWVRSPTVAIHRIGMGAGLGRPAVRAAATVAALAIDKLDEDQNPSRLALIAWALAGVGLPAKEAVPDLIQALRSPDRSLRKAAAEALGAIGPDAAAAVPDLLAAVRWDQNPAQSEAIAALGQIGPAAKDAVPVLVKELVTGDRTTAAEALGGIGPAAKAAVPTLTMIAKDRRADERLREYTARAVMQIDPVFAAKEGLEFAHLNIRLGKVPTIKIKPRPVTPEQTKRARALIAKLAEVDRPDFGLSASLNGRAFAPLPGREQMSSGLIANHGLATATAFRELVEMGPAALPSLLDALGDQTPTKLKVRNNLGGFFGYGAAMPSNPFSAAEKRAVAIKPTAADEDDDGQLDEHTVTVGDVCFVAVGQIVGRPYQAVRYIPSGNVVVNSPTATPVLRDLVRAAWAGDDPAKVLLDSLLTDYVTEGIFNGSSLDGWSEGSDYQVEAVVRLLYYFPDEAAPLIAARLRSMDVAARPGKRDGWMLRDVKNGAYTLDFIKAVAWCKAAPVREALAEIAKKTDEPAIKVAIAAGGK